MNCVPLGVFGYLVRDAIPGRRPDDLSHQRSVGLACVGSPRGDSDASTSGGIPARLDYCRVARFKESPEDGRLDSVLILLCRDALCFAVFPSGPRWYDILFAVVHRERRGSCAPGDRPDGVGCTIALLLFLTPLVATRCRRIARRARGTNENITLSGGSLGSCVDEERSQLRDLM